MQLTNENKTLINKSYLAYLNSIDLSAFPPFIIKKLASIYVNLIQLQFPGIS